MPAAPNTRPFQWRAAVLFVLIALLLGQAPRAQGAGAKIYFIDIGQGASTLIVSPIGKSLLVDGGPDATGAKVIALLDTLNIAAVNFTVLTHYHIDHDAGLTGVLKAGRVAGTAYDNGDDPALQPPNPGTTQSAYNAYKSAIASQPGVSRQTMTPGTVIDLGGGVQVTCMAAGGRLLSGGKVTISNTDLNTESISLLVEYNNFSFLVSGDLTGGGSTSTAATPDVETFVAQQVGDVDVVQLDHHGSTTANNQRFLSLLKAEVAVAQAGVTNTFGHPNRETANKYLNTPVSSGHVFTALGPATPGAGPVFYQTDPSADGDDRVTQQGVHGPAGNGTLVLQTDGATNYVISSFDDGGASVPPAMYVLDATATGVTTDFAPTVMPSISPAVPLASDAVVVSADIHDRESAIAAPTLQYAINGAPQPPLAMTIVGGLYQAVVPAQPDGTRVDFTVSASDGTHTTSYRAGYFAGVTPIGAIRALNANGEPLYAGYAARIRGVVTAGTGTFGNGQNDDYVQDASGAVNVYRTLNPASPATQAMSLGDTVDVGGRIGFNGGRLRLEVTPPFVSATTPYLITTLAPGQPPAPAPATIAQIIAAPEAFEGRLVSIANAAVTGGAFPPAGAALDAFVTVDDGTGSLSLKIDHDTDLPGLSTPTGSFLLVGVVQQDDALRPFDSGYDIAPRSRADVGAAAAGSVLVTIAAARADQQDSAGNAGVDFVPDLLGQTVKVRGAVTSIDFRGGAGIEYYIQDATGGIDLFSTSLVAGPFNVGDSVEAIGAVTQFDGLTEITVTSVTLLPAGTIPPAAPQLVTLSQLANGGAGEALEGRLVRLDSVSIASGSFPGAGADGNVTISDATGSATLRIDKDTDLAGTATPSGSFSVIGVVGQFDTSSPFDSGYQIFPRSHADIVAAAPPPLTVTPLTVNFGAVTLGQTSTQVITIRNTSGAPITLAPPFAVTGTNATQFAAGAPAATALDAGASTTASITFTPVGAVGGRGATVTVAAVGLPPVPVMLNGSAQAATVGFSTPVVVSELRFRGPNGGNDEFVEIYNNTDADIDITGWKLKGSSNTGTTSTRWTIGATSATGTPVKTVVLPARRHYLFTNSSTSGGPYSGTVIGDQAYTTGVNDDGGIALARPDDSIVDQVGLGSGSFYKEGTYLSNLGTSTTSNLNRGYERKQGGVEGNQTDTNSNVDDFLLKAPSEPQNLASEPTPAILVTPATIDFGSIALGRTATITVTVKNLATSATAGSLTSVVSTGDITQFAVGAPASSSLAPGAQTTAQIAFTPTAIGAAGAVVSFGSDRGTRTVAVSGTATPGISVTPTAIDFGTLDVDEDAAPAVVTITNHDPTPVTLTPPFAITGPQAAAFSVGTPGVSALAAGASTTVTVSVAPASLGGKSATLTVTSTNGGARTVALTAAVSCPDIAVSPVSLPGGTVAAMYTETLTAAGASGPFAFEALGSLPPGLSLSAGGVLTGTPTSAGTFAFSVHATEASSCGGAASYAVTVARAAPALAWATPGPITYPAALTGVQLNPTSSVAGTFAFTPRAGIVLDAGAGRTLTAIFTPDDPDNYTGGTVATTIAIGTAPLKVAAYSALRPYGGLNPALTGVVSGVVNGDDLTVSYTTAATPTSPIGEYAIVPALGDPNRRLANYSVTTTEGTLTVTPVALTVDAPSATREFGAPNPAFIGSVSGLVAGDVVTATFDTTATQTSIVASYPIVASLHDPGGRLGNYIVAVHDGVLTVRDTTPPTLNLPSGVTGQALVPAGVVITYAASAQDLADGSVPVTCSPASGSHFVVGATTVDCSATDRHLNTARGSFTVTVNGDATPPVVTRVTPSVTSMWPPNKKMVPVTIGVSASDAIDVHPVCRVTEVTSNEGSSADWEITGPFSVSLRADRNGRGNGRVYTVTVTCADAFGNAATAATRVVVPHDRSDDNSGGDDDNEKNGSDTER